MKIDENSRDADIVPFAIREWLQGLVTWRHLTILAAVILVFVWIAPFGTYTRLSGFERVVYWTMAIGLNWMLGVIATPLAVSVMRSVGWPQWIGVVVGALVAALPGTGVVLVLEAWLDKPMKMATELAYVYASVALIHMVIGSLGAELVRRRRVFSGAPEVQAAPVSAQFLKRLSPALGDQLVHLRMRDHYVEAHTDLGSELVLMRFSDALKEVSGLEGMRVHRSHWVASSAVARVVREGGRTFVELNNGERVPVSRPYRRAVEGL